MVDEKTVSHPRNTYEVSKNETEALVSTAMIDHVIGIPCPKKRQSEALVNNTACLTDYSRCFSLRSLCVDTLTYRYIYKTERISSELAFNNKISMEEGISELVRHAKR